VALAAAGLAPAEVVHVGDTVREDLAGARAAGIAVLLVGDATLAAAAPDAPLVLDLAAAAAWLVARLPRA
jgi:FMN phosphatase YigB (HAD superfamily)